MCQYDRVKKSYEPLMRILIKGSFSFVDLIEKSIFFFTVNLDPDLALLD